jgi:hypothetical protein
MPIEFFICPQVGAGTKADPIRAKYQQGVGVVRAGQLRFTRGAGAESIVMIEADQTYLDNVAADSECTRIADESNMDTPLTAPQVSNIQNFLEARGIPADWLQVGETRRQAIRGVAGMFLFSQRMTGHLGQGWKARLVTHGVTLATEWQALPAQFRTELVEVWNTLAVMLHLSQIVEADVSPTLTMRQVLKAMGNRLQNVPIFIGGVEI